MNIYLRLRSTLYLIFFILFALAANFSISITQFGIGMIMLLVVFDYGIYKIYSYKIGKNQQFLLFEREYLSQKVNYHPYYKYLLLYLLLRIIIVFRSEDILAEIVAARDVWMMAIVPLVVAKIKDGRPMTLIMGALGLGLAATGVFNLHQFFFVVSDVVNFRAAAFNNTNPLTYTGTSGISALLMAGYATYLLRENKKFLAALFFLMAFLGLSGFILSNSRGGQVAIAFAVLFMIAFYLRKKFLFLLPILLLFAVLFYQSDNKYSNSLKIKLAAIAQEGQDHCGSFGQRFDLWRAGIDMFLAKPTFGFGEAGYDKAYQQYKMPQACDVAKNGSHMHNDYLHLAVNLGVFGFFLLLMFYLYPILSYFRQMYSSYSSKNRAMTIWALGGIMLMAFLSLSQCHFIDDEVQMVFWFAVALFIRNNRPIEGEQNP